MTTPKPQRQRLLQFDVLYADAKEQRRAERVEKLLGTTTKLTTAARMFDFEQATAIATTTNRRNER